MGEVVQPAKKRAAAGALLGLSAAMCALAVFQWIELVLVRHGGAAICTVNESINCETVWNSGVATRLHELLHMPVAALGLIWGISALVQAARGWRRSSSGNIAAVVPPLRLLSAVGVAACALFAIASAQAHALCLTCLGTYLLVLAFALTTFLGLRGVSDNSRPAAEDPHTLRWTAGVALAAYLVLLLPGLATPRSAAEVLAQAASAANLPAAPLASAPNASLNASPDATAPQSLPSDGAVNPQSAVLAGKGTAAEALRSFLSLLSADEKSQLGQMLADYRAAIPPTEALAFPPRAVIGDPRARMRLLDFVDLQCPHCREFHQMLLVLLSKLPPDSLAIESRYFPLDSGCNPSIEGPPGNGARCAAAKALICLEKAPDLLELQTRMFNEQQTLTIARALEIAASGSVPRKAIDACVSSKENDKKLLEDEKLAMAYQIKGTPLVVVNGRVVSGIPALLFVLGLTGGDANVPDLLALSQLPATAQH